MSTSLCESIGSEALGMSLFEVPRCVLPFAWAKLIPVQILLQLLSLHSQVFDCLTQVEEARALQAENEALVATVKNTQDQITRLQEVANQLPAARQQHDELKAKAAEVQSLKEQSNRLAGEAASLDSERKRRDELQRQVLAQVL